MIVLAVGVQAGGRAERGIRSRRACITKRGSRRDEQNGRRSGKAERGAHGHKQHCKHGNRAERGADAHRDEQTDERDDDGCDRPAAADGGNAGVHEGVNAAGRLDDRSVAACDEHDDGDLTHQTDAALDLRVDFIPFDCAEHDDHDQTAQCGQCEILTDDLHDRDDDGRAEHDIVAVFELFRDFLRGRGVGFQITIFARPAVEYEHCDEQTEQHGDADAPVRGGNVAYRDRKAVFREVIRDHALKDQAETERNSDIGDLVAEGECARDRTSVEPHAVHHAEQRRHENGNVGDVHGDEVLRQAGDERQHADEGESVTAEQARELFRQDFGKAGRGDAGRERAEQDVGERGRSIACEAARQQLHDGLRALRRGEQGNAARDAADDAGDEHGKQYVETGEAQRAQNEHGNRDRIDEYAENRGHILWKFLLQTENWK